MSHKVGLDTATVTIPSLPPKQLSPNLKYNEAGKKRLREEWQETIAIYIRKRMRDSGFSWTDIAVFQPYDRAEMTIECVIDGVKDRIMDLDNFASMHKSTQDVFKPNGKTNLYGMGIIVNDSPKHLMVTYIQTIDKKRAPLTIITVRELKEV